jgi:hypothetical protein
LVTENESVRHWDARDAKTSDMALTPPFKILVAVVVNVLGPVMTCVIKSSLNWQIVVLHGQMVALQFPDVTPLDSK